MGSEIVCYHRLDCAFDRVTELGDENTEVFQCSQVTAAELKQVHHTFKHNLSYNSADCGHKLNQKILHDSKIIKKMSLGRTKAEAMAKVVLAPKAVADAVDVITSGLGHFSISAKRRESLKEFCQFREILQHVSTRWLSLDPAISRLMQSWTDLRSYFISLEETNKLNLIQKVSMDELYDECTTANRILKGLREGAEDEWKSKVMAAKPHLKNPSIPGYVERIFSSMSNKWSDSRNMCSKELIRSELLITLNFVKSCS
ncbi:unnamed protein product [Leuciscus chuanchicus]